MIPKIVRQAMRETITDIGQLSEAEVATLEAYAKKGWLSKRQGGPYPALKTVWARPGYPFEGARAEAIRDMLAMSARLGETVTIAFETEKGMLYSPKGSEAGSASAGNKR